jgi:hypothetical protein
MDTIQSVITLQYLPKRMYTTSSCVAPAFCWIINEESCLLVYRRIVRSSHLLAIASDTDYALIAALHVQLVGSNEMP